MSDDQLSPTTESGPTPKAFLRVTGLLLWGLVLVCLYFAWHGVRNGDETQSEPVENTTPTVLHDQQPESHRPIETKPSEPLEFELIERSGKIVTAADLKGQPWAVCFVFSRCAGPCPAIMGQMKVLQDELQDADVRLVTITVDPENDTPEQLVKYADAFGADKDRWLFLTGKREDIYRLITYGFEMPVGVQAGQPYHTNRVVHVDADGNIAGTYLFPKESERIKLRRALLGQSPPPPLEDEEDKGSEQRETSDS